MSLQYWNNLSYYYWEGCFKFTTVLSAFFDSLPHFWNYVYIQHGKYSLTRLRFSLLPSGWHYSFFLWHCQTNLTKTINFLKIELWSTFGKLFTQLITGAEVRFHISILLLSLFLLPCFDVRNVCWSVFAIADATGCIWKNCIFRPQIQVCVGVKKIKK